MTIKIFSFTQKLSDLSCHNELLSYWTYRWIAIFLLYKDKCSKSVDLAYDNKHLLINSMLADILGGKTNIFCLSNDNIK